MSERKLLREFDFTKASSGFLVEDMRGQPGGRLTLKGPMQRCEAPNQNKRIYPRKILHREFENMMKSVLEKRAMGELDHPETSTVSLEKVSHVVREMWWDGDTWMGKIEILDTPCGKIAASIIDSGVTLGISSRGVGSTSTNESGVDVVSDDFALVCYDLVCEPSTHGAFMMAEAVNKLLPTQSVSRADRINRALIALKDGDK